MIRLAANSNDSQNHEAYKIHLTAYKDTLIAAKSAYFSTIFTDPCQNPRTLFSTVANLLKPRTNSLPTSTPDLCNSILRFFTDKINIIKQSLSPVSDPPASTQAPTMAPLLHISPDPLTPPPHCHLSQFDLVTLPEISKLISSSKSTTCSLDPLLTPLLKSCLPVLCPYITDLFNSSLSHGTVPSAFKTE
ncbi:hypothetical protein F2P81_005027 [Scophthalmus maximus]|uniref:Uncharacterized protein n=1 Tax=Scophthalmus maximus TaxID=52904 RepID=A0A6A4TJ00_SCOMX|nr:hypothetical protein F2P81_005027 [Scophthalmus maximus]